MKNKKITPESPATQIALLKSFDFGNDTADFYRIHCECDSDDHQASMWIEIDTDENLLSVTFYVVPFVPNNTMWTRIKSAWKMLTTGTTYPQQADLLLNNQGAANLIEVLKKAVKKVN